MNFKYLPRYYYFYFKVFPNTICSTDITNLDFYMICQLHQKLGILLNTY